MNKRKIKYIITSLVFVGCLSTISKTIMADTSYYSNNDLMASTFYAHNDNMEKSEDDKKDKHKGFNVFSEENMQYLSSDQKRDLVELRKCKDKNQKFSPEQDKTLHSLIDCIIKAKLGNEKYEDFKCLIEKKKSNEKLTSEEYKKLKQYKGIIDASKPSTKDILNQFLR
ncbi:hypothetical protein DIC82_00510 [Clostridium beijerinckii]|nr:hypothetical protein DIC82_00510 [Clostridium beijerinckii]